MSERKEAFFRILVLIVSGVILELWSCAAIVVAIAHWVVVVISNKRNKGIAEFLEYWNTEYYKYYRYMTGVSNERPFPFSRISRISKFKK